MIKSRRPRLRGLSINKLIPNMLTMGALSAGLSAMLFGLRDQWEFSLLAILVAAILDGLDGRIARALNATSKFGAELDSLSDFVCFGVAPAMVLYLWGLQDAGRFGWVLVLFFCICCSLRLARFNTDLENPDQPAWTNNFFTGVPSPAGALLALLPMMLAIEFGEDTFREPIIVGIFLIGTGSLLVSRIPTFSFKKFRVPMTYVLPTMLGAGVVIAGIVSVPWTMLTLLGILYIGSIPFSVRSYRRLARKSEERERHKDEDDGNDSAPNTGAEQK